MAKGGKREGAGRKRGSLTNFNLGKSELENLGFNPIKKLTELYNELEKEGKNINLRVDIAKHLTPYGYGKISEQSNPDISNETEYLKIITS